MSVYRREHTVLLAFLTRDHPYRVPVSMGRRYLNVTHRPKKKDAALNASH